MSTVAEIMLQLEQMGSPSIKKVLANHGAREPFFGVKIGDMKPLEKQLKPQYELAKELYATGNTDAMYLAGLIVDDRRMTREDLNEWVAAAYWPSLSESTVPWVAAGGNLGWELAQEWIESPIETTACAGWCTLSGLTAVKLDSELDLAQYRSLMERVTATIHDQPNRVRYSMNGFIIQVSSYVTSLTQFGLECADRIGPVSVMMGETSCKVPGARDYIQKIIDRGTIGKKRKTLKC
jgi:3-methyladenine DNA glycosylase AlkD